MNFSQLHERLRLEVLRRIERGGITATLLARKTGMQQPHISNFLRNKRRLSLPALDRVLAALELSVAELLPSAAPLSQDVAKTIPLVSSQAAIRDDYIRAASVIARIPADLLGAIASLRAEHGTRRPTRDRFVAVTLDAEQAQSMEPRLKPHAIVVLDRHANTPVASPSPMSPYIYAVQLQGQLHFCYLSFDQNRFILRPHSLALPILLLAVPVHTSPSDLVIGRVCFTSQIP